SAARRTASRSSWADAGSRNDSVTRLTATATSAITTISSISVKPHWAARNRRLLPGSDVGVRAFAAGLAVGAETEDIDLTFDTGIEVLVRTTPWVVGQLFEVGTPIR